MTAIAETGVTLSSTRHGAGLHHQSPVNISHTLKVWIAMATRSSELTTTAHLLCSYPLCAHHRHHQTLRPPTLPTTLSFGENPSLCQSSHSIKPQWIRKPPFDVGLHVQSHISHLDAIFAWLLHQQDQAFPGECDFWHPRQCHNHSVAHASHLETAHVFEKPTGDLRYTRYWINV